MGNYRLGRLPRTHRWKQVIELLEQGAPIDDIAQATSWAAYHGLGEVPKDVGFTQTLTAIFQFIDAAKSKDAASALRRHGFELPENATLYDYINSFREKASTEASAARARTDIADIARDAFSQVLMTNLGASVQTLFGVESDNVKAALKSGFAARPLRESMHEFFATFTQRYLNYYLGRELPVHVGEGKRFGNVGEHAEFAKACDLYVRQTVRIADEFTPGWYGKARWENRLIHREVSAFAQVAFKKIRGEFRRGAEEHG